MYFSWNIKWDIFVSFKHCAISATLLISNYYVSNSLEAKQKPETSCKKYVQQCTRNITLFRPFLLKFSKLATKICWKRLLQFLELEKQRILFGTIKILKKTSPKRKWKTGLEFLMRLFFNNSEVMKVNTVCVVIYGLIMRKQAIFTYFLRANLNWAFRQLSKAVI